LSSQSNDILTAVVQGARSDETNEEVTLAAMHALYNSLDFVKDNFEREVSIVLLSLVFRLLTWFLRASETTSCKSSVKRPRTNLQEFR